jgi:hypothetical protein
VVHVAAAGGQVDDPPLRGEGGQVTDHRVSIDPGLAGDGFQAGVTGVVRHLAVAPCYAVHRRHQAGVFADFIKEVGESVLSQERNFYNYPGKRARSWSLHRNYMNQPTKDRFAIQEWPACVRTNHLVQYVVCDASHTTYMTWEKKWILYATL